MTIDKEKLKALAEAATQGERKAEKCIAGIPHVITEEWDIAEVHVTTGANPMADAEFIAAASPDTILALLAEIRRIEIDAAYVMAGSRTQAEVVDQLKAENETLRSLVLSALEDGKGRPGSGGNAPGHCHGVPGVWDRGNGDRSGTQCGWCRIWNAAQAMAKEASHD